MNQLTYNLNKDASTKGLFFRGDIARSLHVMLVNLAF